MMKVRLGENTLKNYGVCENVLETKHESATTEPPDKRFAPVDPFNPDHIILLLFFNMLTHQLKLTN